jgi:hypothetical protein
VINTKGGYLKTKGGENTLATRITSPQAEKVQIEETNTGVTLKITYGSGRQPKPDAQGKVSTNLVYGTSHGWMSLPSGKRLSFNIIG